MKISKRASAVALAAALAIPPVALATNGMFMIGYGAKGTGMGGAGVAYPQDAMAVAYNPALMPEVESPRFDATLELFRPPRAVVHDAGSPFGFTDVRSKNDLFPIPALGAILSDQGGLVSLGVAMVGAGLGTNYPQKPDTFFDPIGDINADGSRRDAHRKVGVFLMQMQILPSIAYKLSDNHNVGVSLSIAAQTFKAWGLEAFGDLNYSSDPQRLTDEGYDWSFGAGVRVGWLSSFFDKRLRLGLNYAPRVNMQKFNRYSGLFANQGEFDIPENFTAGLAYSLTPKTTVAFDVQRIMWSEIDSIGNPGPLASNPDVFWPKCQDATTDAEIDPCRTGGSKGLGFGWNNQTVYKLGVAYQMNPALTLRAGYNYGKAPIPEDQVLFNMLAPATTEKHYTLGATLMIGKDSDLTFSLMYAPENTIKGPTAFPPTPGTVVVGSNASISMSQTSFGIAYGTKF